jgi:hypothetical protein
MKNEELKMKAMKIMIVQFVHRLPFTVHRLSFFALCLLLFQSCQYEEFVPMDYPEELIYLPAAIVAHETTNGIYLIDALPEKTLTGITPGNAYRYRIDEDKNLFDIPLAVFRSGITAGDAFPVAIAVANDTINRLIENRILEDVKLLPAETYQVVSEVMMPKGKDMVSFDILIDLDYLKNQAPQKYALAIRISSTKRKTNPLYDTVVILIDTQITL